MSNTTDSGPESASVDESRIALTWGLLAIYMRNSPLAGGQVGWLPMGECVAISRKPGAFELCQLRPGAFARGETLVDVVCLSRSSTQAELIARPNHVLIRKVGSVETCVNGKPITADGTLLGEDDILRFGKQFGKQAIFRVVRRRRSIPMTDRFDRTLWGPYGRPCRLGIVGESREAWALRERLAHAARIVDARGRAENVLFTGRTGTGKDLCAAAIHILSQRANGPFVKRNITTIVASIAELELFGCLKNVTPGMPAQEGLFASAEGGTLFIDELGALDEALQAKLLQVIETGLYSRVGEARPRQANVRVVAATNAPEKIIRDLYRRFPIKIEVPSLDQRRDDIPLLISHLLSDSPMRTAEVTNLFEKLPIIVEELSQRSFPENVRELRDELWARLEADPPDAPLERDPNRVITREELEMALGDGNTQEKAGEILGISRDRVLYWKRKYGIPSPKDR